MVRIANQLNALGLDRRTLLLFTTDNGTHRSIASYHQTGPIRGQKGYPNAAGTHVPLIAYWPDTIKPNLVSDALIDFTDFLPTLLEVVGSTVPDQFVSDGLSFYGHLTGNADTTRQWIYCHYDPRWGSFKPTRWAQDHHWKLYGDERFFNWSADREEQRVLEEITLDATALHAKNKLQDVLNRMPALAVMESED